MVADRRRGVRRVRPADGGDGPVHQADPVSLALAGPRPDRPTGVAAAGRSVAGPSETLPRAPSGDVHPADDHERRRLPRPVVRDRSAQGHHVRLAGSSARSRASDRPGPPTCCCITTWARSTERSGPGESREAAPAGSAKPSRRRPGASAPRSDAKRRSPRITMRDGRATGVVLESGEEIDAARSCSPAPTPASPSWTWWSPVRCDPSFQATCARFKFRGSSGKVNLALDGLPEFTCLPRPGRRTSGVPSASRRASTTWSGRTTTRSTAGSAVGPFIDMVLPTLVDPSMAPPGKHVMSCFVQYAPYQLADGAPTGTHSARRSATR